MTNNGNLPPFSQEAEAATLGAIISDADMLYAVMDFLTDEDFYLLRHANIWRAMISLAGRNEVIDLLTLSEELKVRGQLDEIGSVAYLMQLVNETPTARYAEFYAHLVERAAIRRRLLAYIDIVRKLALNEEIAIDEVLGKSEQSWNDATKRQALNDSSIDSACREYFTALKQSLKDGEVPGLPYGFEELDKIIGGLYKREVTLWTGGPGQGKTAAVLTVIAKVCKLKARVVLFPFEMMRDDVVQRLVSMETAIPQQRLKQHQINRENEWPLIKAAVERISSWNLNIIDDLETPSPLRIERRLKRLVYEQGVDLVVIDGLWLMEPDDEYAGEKDHVKWSKMTMKLAAVSKLLNVPILLVHQYNQDAKNRTDKRPKLTDMAGGIAIARNVSVALGMYRPSEYDIAAARNFTEVSVLKNRTGNYGTAGLYFNRDTGAYENGVVRTISLENL